MNKNETTARLLDLNELQMYAGLGRNKAIEWGKSIKADVHIGRRVLYDRVVIDRALDEIHRKGAMGNDRSYFEEE